MLGPHKPLLQNHPGLRVLRAHSRNPLYQEGHWKRIMSPGKPKDMRHILLLEHLCCNRARSSLQSPAFVLATQVAQPSLRLHCAVIAPIGQTKPHKHKLLSADLCFHSLHFLSPLLRLLWLKTTSLLMTDALTG